MLELLLFAIVALPLAWLLSEFQRHRWISVVLGCSALAVVAFVSHGWGAFQTGFSINESFGDASKSLATAIVRELEAGNVDVVQKELHRFIETYHPNYENYPRYDEAINKTIVRMRQAG